MFFFLHRCLLKKQRLDVNWSPKTRLFLETPKSFKGLYNSSSGVAWRSSLRLPWQQGVVPGNEYLGFVFFVWWFFYGFEKTMGFITMFSPSFGIISFFPNHLTQNLSLLNFIFSWEVSLNFQTANLSKNSPKNRLLGCLDFNTFQWICCLFCCSYFFHPSDKKILLQQIWNWCLIILIYID